MHLHVLRLIMDNRFSRSALLFGDRNVKLLEKARVAVFGLGGVGAYTAEALVRSGVGYIRIVDFDTVKLSNCNRQILALESTLGYLKTDVALKRFKDINPLCDIDTKVEFVDENTAPRLLEGIDFAIDAIDSVSSKVSLLAHAYTMGIPIVSSMGAAKKTDPFLIRAGDISETQYCPLARIVRKRLHRRNIFKGIRCVYSIEAVGVQSEAEDEDAIDSEETFSRGRERAPLGSIAHMTGIFGLIAARELLEIVLRSDSKNEHVDKNMVSSLEIEDEEHDTLSTR
jgi:tRNA A37 threonylcarbamoyladenosine dehydratase